MTISTGETANIVCTAGVCTPSKKAAILNVTQLENLLASGSVKITTAGSKSSDILITAPISWASASTLTLDAYQSLTINKSISVNGSGGLTILTNDGGTGGDYSFGPKGNATFLATTNALSINGNSYTLVRNIATLASDIAAQPAGFYALASNYNASADGPYSTSPIQTTLTGIFEGLGHTISKLTISNTNDSPQNLALFIEQTGAIRDIGLLGASVSGNSAGALVAPLVVNANGAVMRSYATGKVTGARAGGLVCIAGGSVVDSYATTRVTGAYNSGGLAAENGGTIAQSFATGAVTGKAHAGGLVGFNGGLLENTYATGAVGGSTRAVFGGLVGLNQAQVTQSYSTGQVTVAGTEYQRRTYRRRWNAFRQHHHFLLGRDDIGDITNPGQGAGVPSNDPGIAGLTTAPISIRASRRIRRIDLGRKFES